MIELVSLNKTTIIAKVHHSIANKRQSQAKVSLPANTVNTITRICFSVQSSAARTQLPQTKESVRRVATETCANRKEQHILLRIHRDYPRSIERFRLHESYKHVRPSSKQAKSSRSISRESATQNLNPMI